MPGGLCLCVSGIPREGRFTVAERKRQPHGRVQTPASGKGRRVRRRRGKRTLHYILLIFFVLTAGAVLSMTVFFKTESVTVVGSSHYTPNEIAKTSGILPGDNMLRIDKQVVTERLLAAYPYIDTVHINRKLSRVVELEITQCEPAGAVALSDGESALITKEGKVLERGLIYIPEGVPLIKGISVGSIQPGKYLGKEQQEGLAMLSRLFSAMQETDFPPITNVDVTDKLNMRIMYEARILLELGTEADLPYKLVFVKEMLANQIDSQQHGILYAADAKTKKRVRIKMLDPDEAPEAKESEKELQNANSDYEVENSAENTA